MKALSILLFEYAQSVHMDITGNAVLWALPATGTIGLFPFEIIA
jgi:hypothetical protein